MRRLAALALCLLTLGACKRPDGQPAATAEPAADLELVEPRVELGRTVPGGFVRGAIRLRAGAQGAVITQVSPSCGCTLSDTQLPVTLAPHETFETPVAMDLSRLSDLGAPQDGAARRLERTVGIASAGGARLTATLVTDVSARVRVVPAQVRFASLVPGRTDAVALEVTAPPGVPQPEITGVETGAELTWTPEPAAGAARGILRWAPSGPGELDRDITLRLSDPLEPEVRIRVFGRSELAVTVNPESIEDLAASIRKPVVAGVTLHRRDGLPLEILGASCTAHRVEVQVNAGSGPVRTLRILVPVLAPPAEILGTVIVRTNVEGIPPIEIPVHVRAAT